MEMLTLTQKELDRLRTLQRVHDGYLTQRQAALELGISERQIRRLLVRQHREGDSGVASKRRGAASNHRIDEAVWAAVLKLYEGPYHGFGPTLFAEHLAADHHITVSREWLRNRLRKAGFWKARTRKREVHLPRERRPRFGELCQIDGSPHDWFEGRGPYCTLLVDIDDAGSFVCGARFESAETTDGYFRLVRNHIEAFGRPCAFYADKHSIFRDSKLTADPEACTQFKRALDELGIELICANSPQAKGRVERANRTFQDRLVKAMRLAGICGIDAGNAFIQTFLQAHNQRFAIEAAFDGDAHRSAIGFDLDGILCHHEERVVTKNRTIQIHDTIYALTDPYSNRNLRTGARIQIRLHPDGRITAQHGLHDLTMVECAKRLRNTPVVGSKDLNAHLDRKLSARKKPPIPAANHPWRRYVRRPAPADKPDISTLREPDIITLR